MKRPTDGTVIDMDLFRADRDAWLTGQAVENGLTKLREMQEQSDADEVMQAIEEIERGMHEVITEIDRVADAVATLHRLAPGHNLNALDASLLDVAIGRLMMLQLEKY